MNWIAPSEIDAAKDTLEKRLLGAADQLRANSGHTSDSLTIPASSFSLSANTYLNRIVAQDRFLQTRTFFGKEKKSLAYVIGIMNTLRSNTDDAAFACHVNKAIGGPQASGVLAGRADLIASVALQHQDMEVRALTWNKRALLSDRQLQGIPHQGFGRSMKVGREEVIGLITALKCYTAGSDDDDAARWSVTLAGISQLIGEVPGVRSHIQLNPNKPIPYLILDLDEQTLGFTAYDVVNRLLSGNRPIAVIESRAEFGSLGVNAQGLTAEEAEYVGTRLREVLTGSV